MRSHDENDLKAAFVMGSFGGIVTVSGESPAEAHHARAMTEITAMVFSGSLSGAEAERLIAQADKALEEELAAFIEGHIYPVGT